MSHWTHFVTEADIAPSEAPEHEVFHFSFNNPEALRSEIIEMLADDDEDIAIAEQWEDSPVPEGFDEAYAEALECEARRAEHKGLSACGDDEWARR